MCIPVFATGDFMSESKDVRLQNFLAKIRRGEDVTVVALGGSITTGFAAKTPGKEGWAGLVGEYLRNLADENGSKLTYYNRGVSGTDSAFAIARLQDHVISVKPDLLLLEFAMNDQWLDPKVRERTYEAIIRNTLKNSDTAILVLFVNERKSPYSSAQAVQKPICDYYHLPYVSWKECVKATGKLADFETYFDGQETVHPNNLGHSNIASHIQAKIENVWNELPEDKDIPEVQKELPDSKTFCDYEFVQYLASDNCKPVENTGWDAMSPVHSEWVSAGHVHKGWQTNKEEAEVTFEVEGSSVGITYCERDQFRNAVAWVTYPDGKESPKVKLECMVSYRKGYYGWAYRELVSGKDVKKYTVHIAVAKDPGNTLKGKYCNITGILVAGK